MTIADTPAPARGLGRDWRHLWGAGALSTLGDGALLAAMPLLAAATTDDPVLVSGVTAAATLPWLLLSLPMGAWVDRFDRRRLMMAAQGAHVFLIAVLALLVTFGAARIWMLFVLAFGVGAAGLLVTGAGEALIVSVVPKAALETANGRRVATESVLGEFGGPPLGSALFALAMPLPFWLDAAMFLLALALITRIRAGGAVERSRPRGRMLAEIGEGLRWLARNRLPRTLTLIAGAGNFCETMAMSTLVLFARDVLGVGAGGYGLLVAAMAVGGVAGSLVAGRVVLRFGGRPIALGVQLVIPLSWLGIALVGRSAVTVVALFTVFSLSVALWNVMASSLRQRLIPAELLGRVGGAGRMISFGAIPLGAVCGGLVADAFGLVAPWIVCAALRLLVSLLAWPSLRRWED
ncbi:MFS transporter [Planomonospora sp. ID82291]|uniref:MFS transporter n=1 Tax=Planomonospora sp. ID82291 TaxID=2738136 RepID=UPI0018C3FCBE|nr:MFS transporter [Planomonospora sp. ID82291]MBG0813228.1 MFS transporter [Planomonospora sp. ID82291]